MRRLLAVLFAWGAVACSDRDSEPPAPPPPSAQPALTSGEERARIAPRGEAAATLRSGPQVPVALPRGFTLYPGARIASNTLAERGGTRHMLLVVETADPPAQVLQFYRGQARAAGMAVALDLGGDDRGSLGGRLPSGEVVAISVRRTGDVTRVDFAAD